MLRLLSLITFHSPRLSQLTAEFQEAFPHPAIPPLPRILATVSTSMSKQTDNHFFASVVGSKEFIPMYHDVILWMLKREMIVALHLRVRLVATSELKARVNEERNRKMLRDFAKHDPRSNLRSTSHDSTVNVEEFSPDTQSKNATFFLSPKSARRFARSRDSDRSGISALDFRGADENEEYSPDSEGDSNSELDEEDSGWDTTEDHVGPSMIDDPGKATPMQRRWLSAMSEGKAFAIARRAAFEFADIVLTSVRSSLEHFQCQIIAWIFEHSNTTKTSTGEKQVVRSYNGSGSRPAQRILFGEASDLGVSYREQAEEWCELIEFLKGAGASVCSAIFVTSLEMR